jgi:uncharacterized protein (TIGR02466 family)
MTGSGSEEERLDAAFEPGTIAAQGLFPTPFISARVAAHGVLDAELGATILAREKAERGVVVSNQGGWHSTEFVGWCGPAGMVVLDAARALVDHMTVMRKGSGFVPAAVGWYVTAWANINRAGDSNRAHGHPGAYWSGIYWVDDGGVAEDPALGGMLELGDPRGIMPSMYAPHLRCAIEACHGEGQGQSVTPQAGTIVLFPSWLMHAVTPYAGTRARISVAFNFSLKTAGES